MLNLSTMDSGSLSFINTVFPILISLLVFGVLGFSLMYLRWRMNRGHLGRKGIAVNGIVAAVLLIATFGPYLFGTSMKTEIAYRGGRRYPAFAVIDGVRRPVVQTVLPSMQYGPDIEVKYWLGFVYPKGLNLHAILAFLMCVVWGGIYLQERSYKNRSLQGGDSYSSGTRRKY